MLNPNSTKSVFWLIVILAVAGALVGLYCYKHKSSTPKSGDAAPVDAAPATEE